MSTDLCILPPREPPFCFFSSSSFWREISNLEIRIRFEFQHQFVFRRRRRVCSESKAVTYGALDVVLRFGNSSTLVRLITLVHLRYFTRGQYSSINEKVSCYRLQSFTLIKFYVMLYLRQFQVSR